MQFKKALFTSLMFAGSLTQASTINFDGNSFPCISYNIQQGFNAGAPSTLTRTTNATTIANNRQAACGSAKADVTALNKAGGPGTPASCDEYPFASSNEGGTGIGYQALIVPAFENNTQGGALAGFYLQNGIVNGSAYTVTVSNVPVANNGPIVYGQITITTLPSGQRQCYY